MISRVIKRSLSDRHRLKVNSLLDGVCTGNRASLSQSITLVESKNSTKREMAKEILHSLLTEKTPPHDAYRIGLSGPPGAGKSTFIENMGMFEFDILFGLRLFFSKFISYKL